VVSLHAKVNRLDARITSFEEMPAGLRGGK
jgi:hypothetical protein